MCIVVKDQEYKVSKNQVKRVSQEHRDTREMYLVYRVMKDQPEEDGLVRSRETIGSGDTTSHGDKR